MIIKVKRFSNFQKEFTRQDKKVYKELYKATNGFKEIPEGWRGLKPRDYFRLPILTRCISSTINGKEDYTNNKAFKNMLSKTSNNLSLPETAKGGAHLLRKISNPELISRYNRMKEYKNGAGEVRKKLDVLKEKKDTVDSIVYNGIIYNKLNKVRKGNNLLEQLNNKEESLNNELNKRKGLSILNRKNNAFQKRINESGKKYGDTCERYSNLNKLKRDSVKNNLLNNIKNKGIEYNFDTPEGRTSSIESPLYKKDQSSTSTVIHLHRNPSNSTIAHELGHNDNYDRLSKFFNLDKKNSLSEFTNCGKVDRFFEKDNDLADLSSEYGASTEGIINLKKQGASDREIELSKRSLKNAYGTYFTNKMGDLKVKLIRRFNGYE